MTTPTPCEDREGLQTADLDEVQVTLPDPEFLCALGARVVSLVYADEDGTEWEHDFKSARAVAGDGTILIFGRFTLSDLGIEDDYNDN